MSLVRTPAFDLTSIFNSDNHEPTYTTTATTTDSYSTDSCHLTPGETSFDPTYHFDAKSPVDIDYDEDQVRLKFQEFEKALFDDMNIESPKESSSSESESNFSTTNEALPSCTPKALLFECATAIHNGNREQALKIIDVLRNRVSIVGEPSERIAAYMVEALAARLSISGKGLYRALKCKEQPSSDRLSAMQVLFEACPCFRFGFMAANASILEAFEGEARVHIVDFDINQGSQYYTLLRALSENPDLKRAHVRLTGVDDPESVQRPVGGLRVIGLRLEELAKDLGLSFEFRALPSETSLVSPSTLGLRPGEALVVNFAFQLHHMPDESVSTVNLRDRLLRMVKSLEPKLVTVVEQDVNTNTAPFLTRFADAYSYYSAVFESLDATLARDSQDRMNVEKQCLARDVINVVACEGEERIERYEVSGKWKARMSMAGFGPSPISREVREEIGKVVKLYSDRFKVKEETGALHFGWEDKILIVCSAWR